MSDVKQIVARIEQRERQAADEFLPLAHSELRKLAVAKMAQENLSQTPQATTLVREAYFRLVDVDKAQHWNSRGHFFGAAAKTMRRSLFATGLTTSMARAPRSPLFESRPTQYGKRG